MNAWNTAKLNLQHVSASQIIRYIRIHVQLFLTLRHSSNVIEGREVPWCYHCGRRDEDHTSTNCSWDGAFFPGWSEGVFFFAAQHIDIYIYIRSIVLNKEPANSDPKTITKQYSSVKWVRPHIFLFKPESLNDIPRHYFPSSTWKVDMLPQATTDLKAALDEMDSAMLPAKKAKAPAAKSAAKESWSTSPNIDIKIWWIRF